LEEDDRPPRSPQACDRLQGRHGGDDARRGGSRHVVGGAAQKNPSG
jgi:hypothetical protein